MFPYYEVLEDANDFNIYLADDLVHCNRDFRFLKELNVPFIDKYKSLFLKLNFLDDVIKAHNEKFGEPLFCKDRWTLYEIFSYKDDLEQERLECGLEEITMIKNSTSLMRKLSEYEGYLNLFIELYSNDNAFFVSLRKELQGCLSDLKKVIKIPPKSRIIKKRIPEGWYMTTNGYLYNPNGEVGHDLKGHKDGNLRIDLLYIKERLMNHKDISKRYYNEKESYVEHLKKIQKEGSVTELDFQFYANSIYDFNVVLTKQMLEEKAFSDSVCALPEKEYVTLLLGSKRKTICRNFPERAYFFHLFKTNMEIKRSYQPNINTLVQGYFDAVISLYRAFSMLNVSKQKARNVEKIYEACLKFYKNRYEEVLMRFCGFSKIERGEKKITTARLNGIQLFSQYLEKGFDLYIIPPVVYDKYLDDVSVCDMHSYMLEHYFEKKLKEYKGKGRVLIRDINC